MFKRPSSSKTSTPVRSSDLRRLREELVHSTSITKSFFFPSLDPAGWTSALVKVALPDKMLICKAATHLDEPVTLYLSPATGNDPLFFRPGTGDDHDLVPTCYAIDLLQQAHNHPLQSQNTIKPPGRYVLPTLVTAAAVLDHLITGAARLPGHDSMLIIARYRRHRVTHLTPTRPELLAEFDRGKGGKAVTTQHARGDFLWNSGSKESIVGATSTSWPHGSAGTAKDKGQGVPLGQMPDSLVQPKVEERAELTPADVDVVLLQALLLSIRQTLSKPTAPFPLPASSLYSSHILPHKPASPPHSTVEIKKSSYKTLSAFVKFAVMAGYVVSKEVKGELIIMSVHVEYPDVQAVRIYKTLAQAQARAVQASSKGSEAELGPSGPSLSAISSSPSSVVTTELFKPTSDVVAIFQDVDHPRPERDLYLPVELNETLSHCLLKESESLELLKRSDAITRFQSSCQPYYCVAQANHPVESFKGTPPAMNISVRNVGKRQVTIQTNHETYTSTPLNFYPLQTLLDELKIRTASSVSLQPILRATKEGQTQKMEVVCQGTHDKVVVDMLTSKGVPRRLIAFDLCKAKK